MVVSRNLKTNKRRVGHFIDDLLAPRRSKQFSNELDPTVVGLFGAASGIGESARLCFDALQLLGCDPDAIDLSDAFNQRELDTSRFQNRLEKNTGPLIIHLNPPELPRALRTLGRKCLAHRRLIGYWAWELCDVPASWVRAMRLVHEVWTPSDFCTAALSKCAPVPIKTVPHILPEQGSFPHNAPAPDVDFHVITSGDTRSSLARKNLDGAFRAFHDAFADDPTVRLSVRLGHCTGKDLTAKRFAQQCTGPPNVQLVTNVTDDAAENRFLASADAILSLHRSEGFGLVLAKAMRLGRPVIATGWSGNMEFMTPDNACIVGFERIAVHDPQDIYPETGQFWAEPDHDEAVSWLRRLRSEPELRRSIGEAAARLYPAEKFESMLRDALAQQMP